MSINTGVLLLPMGSIMLFSLDVPLVGNNDLSTMMSPAAVVNYGGVGLQARLFIFSSCCAFGVRKYGAEVP